MSRRFKIGILCNELTRNFQTPLYKETKYWGEKLGVDLFFFEGRQLFGRKYSDIQHNVTFLLANEDFFDGFIFHPIFTHISHEMIVKWCKGFTRKHIVSINKRIADVASCVMVDNYRGMKTLLEHLTAEHKYKEIAFVYGAENNDESRDRFRAYKDYMHSKGWWKEEYVFNGGFESDSGINAIKNIIQSNIDFDAIVFSNDESAIAALDYINNVVPEMLGRFAITGFDNSPHSQLSNPALTSVSQPFSDLARTSLELIISKLEGKQRFPTERLLPTKLAIRESCGCHKRDIIDTSSLKLFTTPYSISENIQSFNRKDFFDRLNQALDPLSISSCFVVTYEEKFNFDESSKPSEYSFLHHAYTNKSPYPIDEPIRFKTSNILPNEFFENGNIKNAVIQSLFYRDEHFGYIVFDGTRAKEIDMDELRSTVSSTLHTVFLFEKLERVLNEKNIAIDKIGSLNKRLSFMNTKLDEISRTDELTATLNRRGFYKAIKAQLEQYTSPVKITLFYADLDKLKTINDIHGHAAGDKAIEMAAWVLSKSFGDDQIIGRMGGDEFVIYTEECDNIEQIIDNINNNLKETNNNTALFDLSISVGHHTFEVSSMDEVEKAIQLADKALYVNKKANPHTQS